MMSKLAGMADQAAEDDSYDYVCIIKKKEPALTYAPALAVLLEDARQNVVDQDMMLYTDSNDPDACSSNNSTDSELQAVGRPSNTENLSSQSHQCLIENTLEVVACPRPKETCSLGAPQPLSTDTGSRPSADSGEVDTGSAAQPCITPTGTTHQQQQNDTMPGFDVVAYNEPVANADLCSSTDASSGPGAAGMSNKPSRSEVAERVVSAAQRSSSIFFARVPPTVPYESIKSLFQQFGKVKLLNLFRPWASAKTSKGCGTVEFEEPSSAVAAMEALHTKFHWTGGETTMVVEWMVPTPDGKDKATPAPGGKAGTSKHPSTAKVAAAAKAAKGVCELRGSGTLKSNNSSPASSGQVCGASFLPHFRGSGYTLVAIPNNLPAHDPAIGVACSLAAEADESARLRHADLAAAEAAALCCMPRLGALVSSATGPGCLGQTAAGQLLGGGGLFGGGGAAASGRNVVARPGNTGVLQADLPDKQACNTARGAGLPSDCHAASLYSSSAPTAPRLAPHSRYQWDLTPPPPSRGLSLLPMYAESVGVSWQDMSLPSSLAGSCIASSFNSVPALQQAGLSNRNLPGVAAMFPTAACDGSGGLSAEMLAMQQLLEELNGRSMRSTPCAATAPGPGPGAARPVSRLLHLSHGPDELHRSRLPQARHGSSAAHHVQPFAGATMTAPEALLLANQACGSVGMPAADPAAQVSSAAQQQLLAFVASCEAGRELQAVQQVSARGLHDLPVDLTRPFGSVCSGLVGSGMGCGPPNVAGWGGGASLVHCMGHAAASSPIYSMAVPTCCQPSARAAV